MIIEGRADAAAAPIADLIVPHLDGRERSRGGPLAPIIARHPMQQPPSLLVPSVQEEKSFARHVPWFAVREIRSRDLFKFVDRIRLNAAKNIRVIGWAVG